MHVRKVAVIFLYLVYVVVVSFVLADKESSNKRMPGSTHAFQQMVRYGRSSNSGSGGKINVYPRADVFYLGPRYGKRSRVPPYRGEPSPFDKFDPRDEQPFPCRFTGVRNFYRCSSNRRSSENQHRK